MWAGNNFIKTLTRSAPFPTFQNKRKRKLDALVQVYPSLKTNVLREQFTKYTQQFVKSNYLEEINFRIYIYVYN